VQHCAMYDSKREGKISRKLVKQALKDADLLQPPLTPVQVLALVAEAKFDDDDHVAYVPFIEGVGPLLQGMCDPRLYYKRAEVQKRAAISTPLAALSDEERSHFMTMVQRIFLGYDTDQSGTLEFAEFRKCLHESQLGLSEKQISYLMSVSDSNDDGTIDYAEFVTLFFEALVELARMEAIERELRQDAIADVAQMLLSPDHLGLNVHILFEMTADGAETVDGPAFADALAVQADKWMEGMSTPMAPIVAKVREAATLTYAQLTEILITMTGAEPQAAAPQAEEAPTGEE